MENWTRPATQADEDAIAAILRDTAMFGADELPVVVDLLRADLEAGAERRWLVREEEGGALSGAACLGLDGLSRDVFNLYFIGVAADHRGRGVGRGLAREAERVARETGGRLILVETSSLPAFEPARRLYRSLGFALDGTIEAYHAPGDDKLVFRKAL